VYKGCAPLRFLINCYYLSKKKEKEETILENLLRVVVSSLWCCQRVDWCYLGSRVCKDGVNVR